MKKTLILLWAVTIAIGATAQSQKPTEEMMRSWRQTVQKRDISGRHLTSNIKQAASSKSSSKSTTGMPRTSFWFPGEWEEVQAVVVTPYYTYEPATSQGSGYWMAEPLVTGVAQYYQYANTGWQERGIGPYRAVIDTSSTFSRVSFYLMDAIQMGGAQAWVRVESFDDSTAVIRHLQTMGLRTGNIRFLEAPGNSFWYRDCGPICFYYGEGDTVGMLDFEYYPGRALDDSLPVYIERQFGLPNFTTMIEWEGGNCLVDGAGMVFSSDALYEKNSDTYGQLVWDGSDPNTISYSTKQSLTSNQVKDSLAALIGTRETYILPAFHYDGGTGHVDLYADMLDENLFVFSKMPANYSNWYDYKVGSRNMDSLCSYESYFGETYRSKAIPFPSRNDGSNFTSQSQYDYQYTRTYSNHTFVNDLIIQPCFSTVGADGMPTAAWDRANIEVLKKVYAGYTIYCVDVREFDGSGGAIHCITKQIPAENPIRILHASIRGRHEELRSENAVVSARISNRSGVAEAKVRYRVAEGEWQEVAMQQGGDGEWTAEIPTTGIGGDDVVVSYYITATSNNGKSIDKPYTAKTGGAYRFGWGESAGVEAADAEEGFGQFYPNPATARANMEIDLGNGGTYNVYIIDAAGRCVHNSTLQAAGRICYTVDTSRLPSGLYMVVFDNGSTRVSRKLVKN